MAVTLDLKPRIPWNKGKLEIRYCLFCGKDYTIRPCESYRKFCSKNCANKNRVGKKLPPFTNEHKKKIGNGNKGKIRYGEQTSHWKGGITPFYNLLRTLDEYNEWRMNCLKRDWFRCQECYTKENLEVHHIKSFTEQVNEFLKEYSQFSIIEDRETLLRLATTYKPFWDVSNGITFCESHHKSLSRSVK